MAESLERNAATDDGIICIGLALIVLITGGISVLILF